MQCNHTDCGRQIISVNIPINIDKLFNIIYTKNQFIDDFFENRKLFDVINTNWTINVAGQYEKFIESKFPIKYSYGGLIPKYSCVNIVFVHFISVLY